MSYVVSGTSNTLLPGLGGSGYSNSNPLQQGSLAKTTALNNAKSGTSIPFAIPGVTGVKTSSTNPFPGGIPASSTGLMNSTMGGVSTPAVKPANYTTLSQDLSNLSKTLGIASGYGIGGVPLNPNQAPPAPNTAPPTTTPANWNIPQSTQPTYSSSGGAIIPQGGAAGTPVAAPKPNVAASAETAAPGQNYVGAPAWYTDAMNQVQPQLSAQGGQLQTQPGFQSQPANSSTPSVPSNTANTGTSNNTNTSTNQLPPNTPAGYASSLAANALAGSPMAGIAANGLLSSTNSPLVQNLLGDYQQKAALAQNFNQRLQQSENNLTQQAIPLNDVEGEQAAMERNYGVQEQALAEQAANALNALQQGISEQGVQQTGFNEAGNLGIAGQNLLQSGLTSAGGLVSPSNLFTQVSPGNYLADSSGNGVAGGMQQGLQNLTQLGIAQQNIAQGQQYQGQAADLSNTLTSLKNTGRQVVSLMGLSGANWSTSPVANQAIKLYMAQANPQAQQSINAGIGEIKNYVSAILASQTGLTPTDVSSIVNAYPFEDLSPNQLSGFLENVDSMGQTRLQALQQSQANSYGGNAGFTSPYGGQIASPTPLAAGQANSPVQAGIGTGISAVQNFVNNPVTQIGAIAEWLFK